VSWRLTRLLLDAILNVLNPILPLGEIYASLPVDHVTSSNLHNPTLSRAVLALSLETKLVRMLPTLPLPTPHPYVKSLRLG